MMNIPIDLDQLKALKDHAVQNGTLKQWADMALEWAAEADNEITRMRYWMENADGFGRPVGLGEVDPVNLWEEYKKS